MSLTFDQKIKAEVKILKAHTKLVNIAHCSSYYIYSWELLKKESKSAKGVKKCKRSQFFLLLLHI